MDNNRLNYNIDSIYQLREKLYIELVGLQNGATTSKRANSVAKLAAHILDAAKLEIIYAESIQRITQQKNSKTIKKLP